MHPFQPGHHSAAKTALRDQLVTTRRRLGPAALGEVARDLAAVLTQAPEVRRAATVAAYVSIGSEPGTGPLLDAAARRRRRGCCSRCCCPTATSTGRRTTATRRWPRRGSACWSRTGPRLGAEAVATADAVLVPGLAVSPTGLRLGRGGGSYDRALRPGAGRHLHLLPAARRRGRPRRAGRAARPPGHRRRDPHAAAPLHSVAGGTSVSVSSAASSTAPRVKAQGSVSPRAQRSVWSV